MRRLADAVEKALVIAFAIGIIVPAVALIRERARFSQLTYWGARLEADRPVQLKTLTKLNSDIREISSGVCDSTVLKAAVSIELVQLDTLDPLSQYEEWSDRLARAETLLEQALGCLPTNGNIWARLAMVKAAIAEQPDEIAYYLGRSVYYSPADEKLLTVRYRFYNHITPATARASIALLLRDFSITCTRRFRYLLADQGRPSPTIKSFLDGSFTGCSEKFSNQKPGQRKITFNAND